MTFKIIAISCLALLLLIPIKMIDGKIYEREMYRDEARTSIANSWTGEQIVYTPMLLQPYVVREPIRKAVSNSGSTFEFTENEFIRLIVPDNLKAEIQVETEKRNRGIYSVPVFTSVLTMEGHFSAQRLSEERKKIQLKDQFLHFKTPYITMVAQDSRGILGAPTIEINEKEQEFLPGSKLPNLPNGLHTEITNSDENIHYKSKLSLRGMESFQIIPVGLDTKVTMQSPWQHPEFIGAFLPVNHNIDTAGFTASWQTNQFSTNIQQQVVDCGNGDCSSLTSGSYGVRLIEGVDVYLQSTRATKYGILFIGLTFVIFFIYENLKQLKIHPVQYTLVGFGLGIFYLLLVSLSEHINFNLAYLVAASVCVALLSYYIRYVLGAWKKSFLFSALYSILYGILFVIIQAEDFAMLMGAILVFIVLSGIMIATRNFDWYSLGGTDTTFKFGKLKFGNSGSETRN